MGSPSEDSFTEIYRRFFSLEEIAEEEEAVTSACALAIQAMQHVSRSPPRPILRHTFILRDHEAANKRLMKGYFDPTPVHVPDVFRQRFRMSQRLFFRINDDLEAKYDYFKQRMDARGYLGFTSIQKVTSTLRILAYGNTYDINNEYLKIGEKTTRDTAEHFCLGICQLYEKRYLRNPTWNDLQQIYEVHLEKHGIPDIIEGYVSGTIPKAGFHASGNDYKHGYYLGDGIYWEHSNSVKTFSEMLDVKRQYFKKLQESSQKDIERCFRVLQQRWQFIRNPCRMWDKEKIRMVMYACIIMRNMIIEDDGKAICQNYFPEDVVEGTQATMEERILNMQLLRSKEIHNTLKADLVEHAWAIRPIRHDGDIKQDYEEEEEVEEFEAGNFANGGLDDGENEEEEGENDDEDED
ncbi:uncharacterized protein LOC110923891 [Helianthus annuus]|uniref:uncharacterized protein LOC110923891 n=1 Tax=Helianthus annuus TaxID=4232 RepID=UPI000B9077F1|nr:uncharacterized protein LOC110923891 [Helianthus annuus]